MDYVVMLNSLDVAVRISDHVIVMVDMRRLNDSTMAMRVLPTTDLNSKLCRRSRCHHTKARCSKKSRFHWNTLVRMLVPVSLKLGSQGIWILRSLNHNDLAYKYDQVREANWASWVWVTTVAMAVRYATPLEAWRWAVHLDRSFLFSRAAWLRRWLGLS